MSLGLTSRASASDTLVASALPGSQEEASLFLTSASLEPRMLKPMVRKTVTAKTIHLVTGPVSLPAICRCMRLLHRFEPVGVIRFSPDLTPTRPLNHRSSPNKSAVPPVMHHDKRH